MRKILMTGVCSILFLTVTAILVPAGAADEKKSDQPAWRNTSLSFDERAADLISRMTLEERVSLLSETEDPIPRLNIPKYYFGNEALHGVVRPGKFTVFPMAIALSSTWDPALILEVATAISDEARGKNNLFKGEITDLYSGLLAFWSPTINMARDPRWGRTPETYGEDPFLTGQIGVNFVRGLQGNDPRYLKVVSTPKHFAANNEEHNRMECNAKISERALREYYLPAYRTLVSEGHAQSIMGAYNAINGVPCNANKKLLTDILRNEWGFDGYVVTDCGAMNNLIYAHKFVKGRKEAAAAALNAGVDLECGGEKILKLNSIEAMKAGLVTEETINHAAFLILRARFRLGMFDPPEMVPYSKISPDVLGSKEHEQLALKTAHEAIVLLKNDGAGGAPLLPLDAKKLRSIALVGPNANTARLGDYSGSPIHDPITPLQGLKNKLGDSVKVNFSQWIAAPGESDAALIPSESLIPAGGEPGAKGLKAEYFSNSRFSGEPSKVRTDGTVDIDTKNKPPDPAIPYGKFSARWTGKLSPALSGNYTIIATVSGGVSLTLDEKTLVEFKPEKTEGFKTGKAFNVDKFGRDSVKKFRADVTLEAGKTYGIEMDYSFTEGSALAKLEWIAPSPEKQKAREDEYDLVKNSDVVIAVLGIGIENEREGLDRDTLDLPADQDEYIRKVVSLNPNTIVVLVNGSPLSINWINQHVPAVIEMWYGGEQGGNALADVLFGDYNPAGRLPVTFYKSVNDLPPFDDYEVSKGRTYMYLEKPAIYPFGHGLSYTKFEYSNLAFDKKAAGKSDTVSVSFDVKNTGGVDGDEVAQLYVHAMDSRVKQPIKMLRGFKRINVAKGQTGGVTISLPVEKLSYWDDKTNGFVVEPGRYEIMIGASSGDIRLKDILEVK